MKLIYKTKTKHYPWDTCNNCIGIPVISTFIDIFNTKLFYYDIPNLRITYEIT